MQLLIQWLNWRTWYVILIIRTSRFILNEEFGNLMVKIWFVLLGPKLTYLLLVRLNEGWKMRCLYEHDEHTTRIRVSITCWIFVSCYSDMFECYIMNFCMTWIYDHYVLEDWLHWESGNTFPLRNLALDVRSIVLD